MATITGASPTVESNRQPSGNVPVLLERPRNEILGTLSAGFLLDDALAKQLKMERTRVP